MRKPGSIVRVLAALGMMATLDGQQATRAADWPQWRGINRSGISPETGLLKEWPASGLRVLWTNKAIGVGYGSVAVSGDRVFVQGSRNRQSIVSVLRLMDGQGLWSKALGPAGYGGGQGSGPRGTPTVDGDRVYVLTENGDLACLRVADGTSVWQRNILQDFGGENIPWDISESPLVDGNYVFVTPGGSGAGIVALDKMTGRTHWVAKELDDEAGYSSLIVGDVQGIRVITALTARAAVGVRAADGKLMWRYERVANGTANIATPVLAGNKVFYSSAYGTGGALLALRADGKGVHAQEVYFTSDMQNHHGGIVLVNGYLYGYSNAILTCLEFETGKVMWRHRSVGKGSLAYADGHLYLVSENHVVGLAEATPMGYREKGRFTITDYGWPSWAHPVVSGGRLYVRNHETLTAYDIQQK